MYVSVIHDLLLHNCHLELSGMASFLTRALCSTIIQTFPWNPINNEILDTLWTSGTKCLYCVSNLSNLGLKLLKKISILSQICLGQNVSIWSQFETFLTFEIQLRLSLFESNLRHFSALSKRCQKGLKNVSKRDLGGFSGWMVFSGT